MKRTKRLVAAVAIVSVSAVMMLQLSGCGNEDSKKLTIAYAPNESTEQSADARNGMSAELKAATGLEVEEIQASDYNAIIEALRTGKADMAYMGALALALGNERAGIEPIAMKADDGDPAKATYKSLFITSSKNTNINSIKDLKGKSIAFVDPDSTSGNLIPTAEILKAFSEENLNANDLHTNDKFFSAASYSGKHQAGLQAVIRGDVEVVPISDQILASEIKNGNAKQEDIKVIHSSEPIPAEAMVVRKDIEPELKNKLSSFLTSYNNANYFKLVIKNEKARFISSTIDDYLNIIELNKLLNKGE